MSHEARARGQSRREEARKLSYLHRLLGEEERVLFSTRQHWTALLGRVWRMLLLLFITLAVAVAANLLPGANLEVRRVFEQWTAQQQWLVRAAISLTLLAYPFGTITLRYLRWRLAQYVVTNSRVMQVSGILAKRVLDSSLEKVNDVMLSQSMLGRVLNYGDLEILTASDISVNKVRRVARPLAFKGAMLNAKNALEGAMRHGPPDAARLIEQLAQLRAQGILTEQEFQAKKAHLPAET